MIENKLKIIAKIKEFRRVIFLNYQSNCNKKINLSDVVDFENGAQPPKSQHIYEKRNGYIRFIQNRDYNSDSHITFIPISRKNHICDEHDIMMDKYGEAGAIRYGIAGAYNVALLKIITKNKHLKEWIRDYLSQPEIKENLFLSSQASTRPSLNESTFISLKLPLMDDSLLFEYENSMNSLLNVELLIKKEILLLKKSKDRLLEKYF